MAVSLHYGSEFTKLIGANAEIARLRTQLSRANKIIGWMMPYIGVMCPPDGGLFDLNAHCCENAVPDPDTHGRPINQEGLPVGRAPLRRKSP